MTPLQFTRTRERLWPAPTKAASRDLAAAALGVSRKAVEHWEAGLRKIQKPTIKLLECLENKK